VGCEQETKAIAAHTKATIRLRAMYRILAWICLRIFAGSWRNRAQVPINVSALSNARFCKSMKSGEVLSRAFDRAVLWIHFRLRDKSGVSLALPEPIAGGKRFLNIHRIKVSVKFCGRYL
jgi:hypothetical protein